MIYIFNISFDLISRSIKSVWSLSYGF